MDMESRHEQIMLNTKGTGRTIRQTARVNSFMWMGIYTKATGKTTRRTEKECIFTTMGLDTREIEIKNYKKDSVLKIGGMAADLRDFIEMGKRMGLELTYEVMVQSTRGNGWIIK